MHFRVIYEFDCPMDDSVNAYKPETRALQMTERWDGEPSEWCSDLFDGKCKHRKYYGTLNRKQFDLLLEKTGLVAEDVQTLGSLTHHGWMPAIAFTADNQEAIQQAYVTPLPDVDPKGDVDRAKAERTWDRIRRAILNVYG